MAGTLVAYTNDLESAAGADRRCVSFRPRLTGPEAVLGYA